MTWPPGSAPRKRTSLATDLNPFVVTTEPQS